MSYIMFGNVAASVPAVKDTTPCMDTMLNYENCIGESDFTNMEIIHPNWPTMWPRLLTDGRLVNPDEDVDPQIQELMDKNNIPLSKKIKQYLWEREHERFVFKSCLRKVLGMERNSKHTSWNTAEVSNLQLT